MNDKDKEMNKIIDAVIEACTTTIDNGIKTISREAVLGKCKNENTNITRSMLAYQLSKFGLCHTTISVLFGKSVQAVRNMVAMHWLLMKDSRAYRIANSQVERMLKECESKE